MPERVVFYRHATPIRPQVPTRRELWAYRNKRSLALIRSYEMSVKEVVRELRRWSSLVEEKLVPAFSDLARLIREASGSNHE